MKTVIQALSASVNASQTPLVSQLDHLNLTVKDLQATVDWYQRVFGFVLVESGLKNGIQWGIIQAQDALLCLYEYPDWQEVEQRSHHKIHGINHFGLRISDPSRWEETIIQQGVEVLYGGAIAYPHSTSWYIADPTGHEIEVAYWPHGQLCFD